MGKWDAWESESAKPNVSATKSKWGAWDTPETEEPEEKDFRGWLWNLARRIPQYTAGLPAAALPPPMREPVGLISKAVDPIRKKVESLPIFSPLKRLEEQIFGEGKLHEPEIIPETVGGRIKRQVKTVAQAPDVPEALMRIGEQLPGVALAPRHIRSGLETWYTDPLPNIMDAMILLGGYEAAVRAKAPKTLEAPYIKFEKPEVAFRIGEEIITDPHRIAKLHADIPLTEGQQFKIVSTPKDPSGWLYEGKFYGRESAQRMWQLESIAESIAKVTETLKEAKPKRVKQEEIYLKERGEKLARGIAAEEAIGGGEAGFYAKLGKMKGELTRVEFESIRKKVSQSDIDNIFRAVNESPELAVWERLPAGKGLGKIFGEHGGKVPTENEIMLLNRALGSEFTKAALSKRSMWKKAKEAGWQIANIPRSIMASFDLSAPFRQGIFMIYKPKQFFGQFKDMFKAFGSEKAYKAGMESIRGDTRLDVPGKTQAALIKEVKLGLTELERGLVGREEAFMSNWAEHIPGIGRIVRASGRAHTLFLNKLRNDNFVDLVLKADKAGIPRTFDLTKGLSDFINNATGRGSMGKLQSSAVALNTFFFSPRLMSSRLRLLNPYYYINPRTPKFVRKEALKALCAYTGAVTSTLTLAKMAGAEVGLDPRNANFGKIMIGKARVDIMGGFQQYIRAMGQFFGNQYISSISGKRVTLGEGYKPISQRDILLRQVESKMAPFASFVNDLLARQDWKGDPISVPKEIGRRMVPMVMMDMAEIAKEDPKLLPLGIAGMFGVGLQYYELYSPKVREFYGLLSDAEEIDKKYKGLRPSEQAGFAEQNRQLLGSVSSLRSLSRQMSDIRKQIEEVQKSNVPKEEKKKRIAELEGQIEALAGQGLQLREEGTESKWGAWGE